MLPSTVPIVRSDFEGSFDAHDFLLAHCQYRTLNDLHQEVKDWEQQLQRQLESLVNENYDELLGAHKGLKAAQTDLGQVKLEVLQFQEAISRSAQALGQERAAAEQHHKTQRQLAAEKQTIKELVQFLDWLDWIDTLEPQDELQLVVQSKIAVSLELYAQKHAKTEIVKNNLPRVASAKQTVLKRINGLLKQSPSLELAKAKSWLL